MNYDDKLKRAIAFHGHICPGLVYGYRVSLTALEHFGSKVQDGDLVAVVENDSCAVDAIQILTGCTFGNGGLVHKEYGKQVYTFYHRASGEGLRLSVAFSCEETADEKTLWERFIGGERTPELVSAIEALKTKKIEAILKAPRDEVIGARSVRGPMPPEARVYPGIRCAVCGEKVMEPRARVKNGQIVCIPCS